MQLSLNVEPSESKTADTKTEFNIKYLKFKVKVILGHLFCNQLQAGNGLLIAI